MSPNLRLLTEPRPSTFGASVQIFSIMHRKFVLRPSHSHMPSFFRRIRFRNLSRRRVALLCLAVGILTVRLIDENDKMERPSQLPVQIAKFAPGVRDGGYQFDPAEGRDINAYDQGEHVDDCSWYADDEFETCRKQTVKRREIARRFIFEHWRSKTLGYLSIDRPCIDCDPTDHIFIEPDELGGWRILIVAAESRYPPRYFAAHDVRYRRATKDDRTEQQATRILSFRDSAGREIDRF